MGTSANTVLVLGQRLQRSNKTDAAETYRFHCAPLLLLLDVSLVYSLHQWVCLSDVESAKSTMQAQYVEQLAELERRLNNARREHTKAGRWRP